MPSDEIDAIIECETGFPEPWRGWNLFATLLGAALILAAIGLVLP